MPRSPTALALLASLGLHGALGVWVKVRSTEVAPRHETRPDVWSGRGIEIDPSAAEVAPSTEVVANDPGVAVNEPATTTNGSRESEVALDPVCAVNCAPEVKQPPAAPERAPRPRPEPRPPASASAASTASSTPSAGPAATAPPIASGAGTSNGEAFGTVGLPPGVRYLPKAYTRALPQGSWGLAGFRSVPPGTLCEARVAIAVADDKRLGVLEYPDGEERSALPELCKKMFENAHRLVQNGEFSLDPKTLTAGLMRLRIEVAVSDGEARPDDDSKQMFEHDPPAPGKRGRGTFVLPGGRRVDAFVNLE